MAVGKNRTRVTCTLDDPVAVQLAYWADQHEETMSDYMANAIETAIAHENDDWRAEIPDALTTRINELSAHVVALQASIRQLMDVNIQGFSAITDLARGDTYLQADTPEGREPLDVDGGEQ